MTNPLDDLLDTYAAEDALAVSGDAIAGGITRPAETGVQAVARIADRAVELGARPPVLPAAPHICEVSGVLAHTAAECAVADRAVAAAKGRNLTLPPAGTHWGACTDCGVPDGRPCAMSCPSNAHWDD